MSEKDFDKGYKSGFQFGKEVANEEWLNKIKQAREEMKWLANEHKFQSNVIYQCIVILDKLTAESGGENE